LPYVDIKLPVCNRCHHVWLPEPENPEEPPVRRINLVYVLAKRKEPKTCANCRSPYWNKKRKHKKHTRPLVRKPRSTPEQIRARVASTSVDKIFADVMKAVKTK